jgi:putative phosphoesterase
MPYVIGLISDTHGLLRPQVYGALAGVDLIFHAGDVGGDDILQDLALIAPVQAVYGNTDPPGDPHLRQSIERLFDGLRLLVTHGHELGRPKPAQLLAHYDADVIVYGHTHRQIIAREEGGKGRLVVNPGSAGPKRFDLSPSVARLIIQDGRAEAEIVSLV